MISFALQFFEPIKETIQATPSFDELFTHTATLFCDGINHASVSEWFGRD